MCACACVCNVCLFPLPCQTLTKHWELDHSVSTLWACVSGHVCVFTSSQMCLHITKREAWHSPGDNVSLLSTYKSVQKLTWLILKTFNDLYRFCFNRCRHFLAILFSSSSLASNFGCIVLVWIPTQPAPRRSRERLYDSGQWISSLLYLPLFLLSQAGMLMAAFVTGSVILCDWQADWQLSETPHGNVAFAESLRCFNSTRALISPQRGLPRSDQSARNY